MEKLSTGSEILKKLLSELGVTVYELANKCGYEREQAFYDVINGKTKKISFEMAKRIVSAYPSVSLDFLYDGSGDVIKAVAIEKSKVAAVSGVKPIILYDVDAAAGYESFDVMISKEKIIGEFIVPTFASADWMIHVRGSSMYPKYSSGDIIACKVIKESRFIQWNKVYVVATREQGLLVKRLMPSEKEECIKAVSDNEKYPPFDIPKDEIFGLALVLGAIKLE